MSYICLDCVEFLRGLERRDLSVTLDQEGILLDRDGVLVGLNSSPVVDSSDGVWILEAAVPYTL